MRLLFLNANICFHKIFLAKFCNRKSMSFLEQLIYYSEDRVRPLFHFFYFITAKFMLKTNKERAPDETGYPDLRAKETGTGM